MFLIVSGTFIFILRITGFVSPEEFDFSMDSVLYMSPTMLPVYLFSLIFFVFLHLGLKFAFTFLFCSDRWNSLQLKFLKDKGLPVCYCREAFKVWQTVVIYLVPAVIVYTAMFLISITFVSYPFQEIEVGFMTMLFFMTFFLAWDLTLITYVLAAKIKDKINYIAINHHVYDITLFRPTYIRLGRRASRKRIEAVRQKRNTRIFTKITTCANINCGNYGEDIGENTKTCPLCGRKRYIAEVFTHLITCVNPQCENFGYELNREIKECSNCGEELKNLALKFRPDLTKPTVILTLIFVIIFSLVHFFMINRSMVGGFTVQVINLLKYAAFALCIVRGWISRNRWVLLFVTAAFLFVQFGLGYFIY
jgi:hypothetical protein